MQKSLGYSNILLQTTLRATPCVCVGRQSHFIVFRPRLLYVFYSIRNCVQNALNSFGAAALVFVPSPVWFPSPPRIFHVRSPNWCAQLKEIALRVWLLRVCMQYIIKTKHNIQVKQVKG